MGEEKKLQYHPPACAALELELRENKESITVTPEFRLNTKPNEIDILVILKEPGKKLKSGLAAIFRTINLWEYKSPGDQLGKRIYYRSAGYAFLYLCYFGEGMDERDLLNAESVYDLMCRINRDKEWMKEGKVMGELRDLFKEDFESRDRKIRELNEQLEQQSEQLEQQSEQLELKDEQLEQQSEQLEQKDREIAMLREKLAALA